MVAASASGEPTAPMNRALYAVETFVQALPSASPGAVNR